jgi:hypothetical protein
MKAWILAGILSTATIPFASASEMTDECQLDESRRAERRNATAAPAAPTVAQSTVAERAPEPSRAQAQRRRSGKHIPDAELIGVRGAL